MACSTKIPARLKGQDSCNLKSVIFWPHTYNIWHTNYNVLESHGSNVNLSLVSEILGDIVIFYKRQLGTFAQVSKWYLLIYIKCSF